jgi:hypothetical protein
VVVYMEFVVDRVALGQVPLRGIWFPNVIYHHRNFPCLFICRSRVGESIL